MRSNVLRLLAVAVVLALASTAYAANVKLKGGKNAEPTFMDNGLTLEAIISLTGLGNGDIFISLDAAADAFSTCTNPAGATQPPGQNPAPVDVSGGELIEQEEIKNGNLTTSAETNAPVTPLPGAPGCPNPQWTQDITDLAFTSVIISVEQPVGTLVLEIECTFTPATSNGVVPKGDVECTQTQF